MKCLTLSLLERHARTHPEHQITIHYDLYPMLSPISSTQTGVELAFTSLDSEIEIDNLPVEGEIPHWLNGVLFRNGPAKFEIGEASYNLLV